MHGAFSLAALARDWDSPLNALKDHLDRDANATFRDGDRVLRTYFVNNRGDEALGSTWSYLDLSALGRQENLGELARGLSAERAVPLVELAFPAAVRAA